MNKKIIVFTAAVTLCSGIWAGKTTEKIKPAYEKQELKEDEKVSSGYVARLEGKSVNIYCNEEGTEKFSHNIEGVNTLCLPEKTTESLKSGIWLETEEKLQKFVEEITS